MLVLEVVVLEHEADVAVVIVEVEVEASDDVDSLSRSKFDDVVGEAITKLFFKQKHGKKTVGCTLKLKKNDDDKKTVKYEN